MSVTFWTLFGYNIHYLVLSSKLDKKMYGSRLVRIPTPKLVTLYNGTADVEDGVLHLSDCFMNPGEGDIEANVHVYNINPGKELPGKCEPLAEYSQFIDICRKSSPGITDETVSAAIEQLPDGTIKQYLISQKAMVVDMILTECDVEGVMEELKAEAREEGQMAMAQRMFAAGLSFEMVRKCVDDQISDTELHRIKNEICNN